MKRLMLVLLALIVPVAMAGGVSTLHAADPAANVASGWIVVKYPGAQPACTGVGWQGFTYFDRLDCGFGWVGVSGTTATSTVKVSTIDSGGTTRVSNAATTYRTAEQAWQFNFVPGAAWAPGPVTIRVTEVNGVAGNYGETTLQLNILGGTVAATGGPFAPGDAIPVSGTVHEIDQQAPLTGQQTKGVPATFKLRVVESDGTVVYTSPTLTGSAVPASEGTFSHIIPAGATSGVTATEETGFRTLLRLEIIDAAYTDPLTGAWAAPVAGGGSVELAVPPSGLLLENRFVSSVGWVKPGEQYPFRVFMRNYSATVATGASVTIPAVDGMTFLAATALGGGSATVAGDGSSVTWTVGNVPAAGAAGPGVNTLVVEARARTLGEDQEVVWKNLSTTATRTDAGGSNEQSTSRGPKVIPPKATYDTARYGERPFPVVPVDYFDRKHAATHTGDVLSAKINSPSLPGSTFNLYQENSYGQLFPQGTVPSAGRASADWTYGPGFDFTTPAPQGACNGTSFRDIKGTPLYPERIVNGWYQLPGDTAYYGADQFGTALVGAQAGVGPLMQIDNACGPTGKMVYDAAAIADPEIDYSDYDTDKDGVVDFFMAVFVGAGGHGASQTSAPPYDNIWPHSSSLESYYTDTATGLKGYISDDQLKNLKGEPLWFADTSRSAMTTTDTGDALKVFVRVGPYNVNPETAIDNASVISHEYGHSLGLPDFYSLGTRETLGDWNLMATDKSQNMDVFSKQELGWLIPLEIPVGASSVSGWQDSKVDQNSITWKRPDGTPYTLSGPTVHNGEAYGVKLPAKKLIDPAKFDAAGPGVGASPTKAWWSGSGNDFGCPPSGGHNLDIFIPETADLPNGTPVTVTFKSLWDIEWDYDYGFVLKSTDGGASYTSLASGNGYTTALPLNPNANACLTQYNNGITGSSGSYEAATQVADRATATYPSPGFLADSYTFNSEVDKPTVLRFSYSTDPGLARPGWFIDDLKIAAGSTVIYETDFESSGGADDPRVFSGGCKDYLSVAATCTDGWNHVDSASGSPADHAYYLEMRDRSGFDESGMGENDREAIAFSSGLLLEYTNESHGYGNVGTGNPPAQTPLDSQPQPGSDTPNLHDAAFTSLAADNVFSDSGVGHTDNYTDPANTEVDSRYPSVVNPWRLRFDCLTFSVTAMTGEDVALPYNLQGDVQFTRNAGCAPWDFGFGVPNQGPVAVAQARPTTVNVDDPVTFDGSLSYDDVTPLSGLTLEWDFDGDGTYDATGQSQQHSYPLPGSYDAKLRVTDAGGLQAIDTITITVQLLCAGLEPTIVGTPAGETITGTTGKDIIAGIGGDDTINGLGNSDTICGGAGNDTINGGDGNDALRGGQGDDAFFGGAGNDSVKYSESRAGVTASLTSNVATGEGSDTFNSIQHLYGSIYNDILVGDGGVNFLSGGSANDTIDGRLGADTFDGGPGFDRALYSSRTADLSLTLDDLANDGVAGEGDTLESDLERLVGGSGNDTLTATDFDNRLEGGPGNDTLNGLGGKDVLDGGTGTDVINGGDSADTALYDTRTSGVTVTIDGNANDGEPGEGDNVKLDVERVYGGSGNDSITGTDDAAVVNYLYGFGGADQMFGLAGKDRLYGGDDNDNLDGGAHNDLLMGGPGDDTLNGNTGTDTCRQEDGSGTLTSCEL